MTSDSQSYRGSSSSGKTSDEIGSWSAVYNSVLGALYMASKQPRSSSRTVLLIVMFQSLQLLAVAVSLVDDAQHLSSNGAISVVSNILSAFTVGSAIEALQLSTGVLIAAWAISTTWMLGLAGLFALIAWKFWRRLPQSRLQLQTLRQTALLSATALVIPNISVQLTWIACAPGRTTEAVGACWTNWHAPSAVLGIVLIPVYLWICAMVLLSYVDHTLQRPTYGAKLHGRGDVVLLITQAVVIAVFSLTSSDDGSALWFRFVSLLFLAAGWLNAFVMWQPHIVGTINDIRAGLGGMFAWATLCAFVVLASSLVDVTALLFGGLVPAFLMAAGAARLRRLQVQQLPLDKVQTVVDAHQWALHRLHLHSKVRDSRLSPNLQVVVAVVNDTLARGQHRHRRQQPSTSLGSTQSEGDRLLRRKASHAPSVGSAGADQDSDSSDSNTLMAGRSAATTNHGLLDNVTGADFNSQKLSSSLRAMLVEQASDAFDTATGLAGSQPLAYFAQALFQRNFRNSRYTEFAALRAAKAASPGFDVAFFVYQRHRQLNEAKANTNSSGEASLSAIDRLLYEQHSTDAADASLEWSIGQARLWGALAESVPNMDDLHTHTITLATALLKADTAYNAMRRLNPNSSALLRAVGQYMVTMRGDTEAGELLLAQADRMEQVALQRSQQVVKRFVYGQTLKRGSSSIDETSASITLSGSLHSLGQVLDANAAASHIFGCSRSALLSKRFPDLFPPILAPAMDAAMYEYTSRGRGLDFQSASLRLVLSTSGALVPVVLQLAEVPSVDDSDVVNFQLILQAVRLPHEIALVQGPAHAYRIVSMTAGGAATLGVDLTPAASSSNTAVAMAEEDASVERSLLRYFPELDLEQSTLLFGGLSLHVGLAALRESVGGGAAMRAASGGDEPMATKGSARHPRGSISTVQPSVLRNGTEVVQTDVLGARSGKASSPAGTQVPSLTGHLTHVQVQPVADMFLGGDLHVVNWALEDSRQGSGAVGTLAIVAQGVVQGQRASRHAQPPPQHAIFEGHIESKSGPPSAARQPVTLLAPVHKTRPQAPRPQVLPAAAVDSEYSAPGPAHAARMPPLSKARSASTSGGVSPAKRAPLSPLGSRSFNTSDGIAQSAGQQQQAPGAMSTAVAPASTAAGAMLDDAGSPPRALASSGSWRQPDDTQQRTDASPRQASGADDNPQEMQDAALSPQPSLMTRSADSAAEAAAAAAAAGGGGRQPQEGSTNESDGNNIFDITAEGMTQRDGTKSLTVQTLANDNDQPQLSIVSTGAGQDAMQPAARPSPLIHTAKEQLVPDSKSALPPVSGSVTFSGLEKDSPPSKQGGGGNVAPSTSTHFDALSTLHSEMSTFDEQVKSAEEEGGEGAEGGVAGRSTRYMGASQSVAASMVSVGARLRLGLLGIVTNEVHPLTRRVVKVLLLMCAVATLVVIVQLGIVAAQFNASQRQIGTVLTNERRAGLVVKSTVVVQVAAVSIETGIPILPAAVAEAALLHTADELETATSQIIEDFDVLSGTNVASLESKPITLTEFTGTGSRQQLNLTLSDACVWFVSHLRRAAPAFASGNLQQASVTTVLSSGISVLVPALIESGAERIALYSATVKDQQQDRINESTVIFVVVVVISLAFIWVYMLLLDFHRQEMLGVLRHVPRTTAARMKQAAHNTLLARANDEMAAEKMDSGGEFVGDFSANMTEEEDDDGAASGMFASGTAARLTVQERKFKTTVRTRRAAATFLSLPVIIVGGMLLAMFFVRQVFRARIEEAAQRTYLTHRLYQDMFQYATYSTALISPTVLASLSGGGGITLEQLDLAFAAQQSGMLDRLDQLLQGTANGPIDAVTTTALDRDSNIGKLLLNDACEFFEPSFPGFGTVQGCREQRNAVLVSGGLQSGITELVSIVRRSFGSILLAFSPDTVPATVPLLQGTAVQEAAAASTLILPYLSGLTLLATERQEADMEALGTREFALLIVTAALFILLLLASVLCVFVPFARRIGRQATATQVALAMLPPELLQRTPALQAAAHAATRKVIIGQAGRDAARRGYVVEPLRNG